MGNERKIRRKGINRDVQVKGGAIRGKLEIDIGIVHVT